MTWKHRIPLRRDPGLGCFLLPSLLLALAALVVLPPREEGRQITPVALEELRENFDEATYSWTGLIAGEDRVPALYLTRLPEDWRQLEQVEERKQLFLKSILPLVLHANAAVLEDRARLEALLAAEEIGAAERRWLAALARRYGLEDAPEDEISAKRLLKRVDAVPVSLALAQAANESGWGQARFTLEGNALFGQWTWNDAEGIVPKARPSGERYAVRAFETLGASVAGYLHNLNVHPAYREFRELRAALRAEDAPLEGAHLAAGLRAYSERGDDYVAELRAMIRQNALDALDGASLSLAE